MNIRLRSGLVSYYTRSYSRRKKGCLKKTAPHEAGPDVRCLAMSYFHMGKPHTIIGDEPFHGRVRKGIGWYQFSMVTRRKKIWMIHKRSIKRKV